MKTNNKVQSEYGKYLKKNVTYLYYDSFELKIELIESNGMAMDSIKESKYLINEGLFEGDVYLTSFLVNENEVSINDFREEMPRFFEILDSIDISFLFTKQRFFFIQEEMEFYFDKYKIVSKEKDIEYVFKPSCLESYNCKEIAGFFFRNNALVCATNYYDENKKLKGLLTIYDLNLNKIIECIKMDNRIVYLLKNDESTITVEQLNSEKVGIRNFDF
ncbi:MAG: hypothetical protein MK105_02315 [Crocinitomicaceae bacterium]|nr:hypothetical protein [Crocinitomicaceae bacterium]